jgi:peptidoglycan/LPS O-acetylase OafA/YrhL
MRIVGLDALRGAAALAVAVPHYFVAHHFHPVLFQSISIVSVEVFFVLSGFVLAPQINYCLEGDSRKNLQIFYGRRWMRTIPPYVVALCLVAILTSNSFTPEFLRYLFFVQNVASIDETNDFFPIAWSLSIEEWFYLLFPLFLLTLGRFGCGPIRAALIFIAAFFAFKLAGAALMPDWNGEARRLIIFRLDAIAFGFLLSFLISRLPNLTSRPALPLQFAFFGVVAIAMAAIMATLSTDGHTAIRFLFFYVSPLFGGSLIGIFCATNNAFVEWRAVERLSTFLGSISYDIYLFHIPVMLVVDRVVAPPAILFALYIFGVLGVSALMRLAVENRILAARPEYARIKGDRLLWPSEPAEEPQLPS